MKEIMLIGKSVLGECGFCQIPSKMLDTEGNRLYFKQLEKIKETSDRTWLVSTSMIPICDLEEMNYDYLPSVIMYNEGYRDIFDPEKIYLSAEEGYVSNIPSVDFLVWDRIHQPITVMTFTKTAPVLYFEAKNGMSCLGTVLRKALVKHSLFIFEKIFKVMKAGEDNPIKIVLASSTSKCYDDMSSSSIYEHIQAFLLDFDFVKEFNYLHNVEEESECYLAEEKGNHVILVK